MTNPFVADMKKNVQFLGLNFCISMAAAYVPAFFAILVYKLGSINDLWELLPAISQSLLTPLYVFLMILGGTLSILTGDTSYWGMPVFRTILLLLFLIIGLCLWGSVKFKGKWYSYAFGITGFFLWFFIGLAGYSGG